MINKTTFTHDAAAVVFKDDADGITVDEDGDVEFDWDEVERVRVDDVPWADAFETTEFYKLPATVAKPIPQEYRFGEDTLTLKKPRQELKNAAWSLHNAPWTLGHPGTGMVKDVNDVHGFWRDPRYIDSIDNLDADLYVPVADEDARSFLERNADVSVGFYNKTVGVDSYDGVVGGNDSDAESIDGYQTNMLFDHVASVPVGRCSGEAGCGIQDAPSEKGKITDAFKLSDSRVLMGDSYLSADEEHSVQVGDTVRPMHPHMPEHEGMEGVVAEIEEDAKFLVIDFEHEEGHKWYADYEVEVVSSEEMDEEHEEEATEEDITYNSNPDTAHVFVPQQEGDGNHVVIGEAKHETMDFWTCVHLEGDEYEQPDGPNLSSAIGEIGPWPAGTAPPHAIMLEEELQHGQEFYVTLHADDDGEKGEHIRDAAENFIFDTGEFHAIGTNAEQEEEPVNPEEAEETEDGFDYDHSPFVKSVTTDSGAVMLKTKDGAFIKDTDITHDYRDEDGNFFAVAPDENPDGVPKYPIDSCTGEDSVESAWHLRNHGDIDISVDTLEERIKRRASALDCDVAPWENGEENNDSEIIMTEKTQDCGGLGLTDLSVDAVAAKHEGVQEAIDAKDAKIAELEDKLSEAEDATEKVDELQEKVDEYEADEKAELVDEILARTDAMGDEETLMEKDVDELEEDLELVKSLSADDVVANGDGAGETPTITGPKRKTPWD